MAVVKTDVIQLVMLGAKADVGIHVKANVIQPAKMDVQMHVGAAKVAAHITVQTVVAIARAVA